MTRGRADLVFWALFVTAMVVTLVPLWVGPIPPLTDFGGHLQMADAWVRIDESPLYQGLLQRQGGLLDSQILAVRTVALLHPLMDTISALRVFVSLGLVVLAGSLLWTLSVFGRSRWLIFLCLPLLWNGMLQLGLINYVLSMGMMFFGVSAARRLGLQPSWTAGLRLGLIGLMGFWAHAVGYTLLLAMSLGVLALSLRRYRHVFWALVMLPSFIIWWVWWRGLRSDLGLRNVELTGVDPRTRVLPAEASVDIFLQDTLNIVHGDHDTLAFLVIAAVLLVLLATQAARQARPSDRARRGLARLWRQIKREAHDAPLLWLTVALGLSFFFIAPASIRGVAISPRLVVPLILTMCLLPRVAHGAPLARAAIAVAVLNCFWFPLSLSADVRALQALELDPMLEVIDRIPEGSRAQCVGVRRESPVFVRLPLSHNCNGLIHVRRASFAGGGFAHTTHNAVRLRSHNEFLQLKEEQWQDHGVLRRLDYVVVRGPHRPPRPDWAQMVHQAQATNPWGAGGPAWTLYQVVKPEAFESVHEASAGGTGGLRFEWACSPGQVLSGVSAVTPKVGTGVANLRPICRAIERDRGRLYHKGRTFRGPRFGAGEPKRTATLTCPRGQFLLGLAGRAGERLDEVGVICGDPLQRPYDAIDGHWLWRAIARPAPQRLFGDAEGEGEPFWIRCPAGSLARGIVGRDGALIDALGIRCETVESAVPEAPPPPSTEPPE